jgi:hypothetical protein
MPALLAKQGKIVQTKPSGNVRPAVFRRNQSLGVVAKPPSPTPQAYLHWERKSDTKHEYPDGVVGAMEGASWEQGLVTGNMQGELYAQLKETPCATVPQALRVRVPQGNRY